MSRALTLTRTSDFPDPYRPYRILLDGRPVASLHPYEKVVLEPTPGGHVLEACIGRASAPPYTFQWTGGEDVELQVTTRLKGLSAILNLAVMLFRPGAYLLIGPTSSKS